MVTTVIAEDGQFDERYRIVRDDGAERWMHVVARKGSPTRLLGASVDETDRIEAEHRTALQVARVAAAVDLAEVGFSEWTVGAGPPYVDTRLRGLLGLEHEAGEAIQQRWLSRIHPDDRQEVDERRRRLLAGEIDHLAVEYRYAHPGRGGIWVRHTSRRDVVAASGAVRVVGAVQDITERKRHAEELQRALDEVKRLRDRVEQENVYLRHEVRRREGPALVVGRSQAIRRALSLVEQVAPTDSTVLLLGETGCGKERFATLLHEASRRRERTMIRVNCAAIPVALIESELFGREKGAFTGAVSRQLGRFELAHGSTLFLDEVGDLPAETQVKLLRVLEEHTIERLGSAKPVRVDVRIIAATHRDLRRAVAQGTFREDLYYRLHVFPLAVPPLRERREDIPLLVSAFVDEFAASMGKRINGIDPSTLEALSAHAWPGNIRELRNVVERAMIMATSPVLRVDPALLEPVLERAPVQPDGNERARLLDVLQETGWRVRGEQGAAARLGLKPTTLEARMRRLGITRPGLAAFLAFVQAAADPVIASLL
jgi:PAS domain S-box-containing protein